MNKHIFEFDKQAQEYAAMELATVNTGGLVEFNRLYRNKFAELIVRGCAKVILETPVDYMEIDAMHRIRD